MPPRPRAVSRLALGLAAAALSACASTSATQAAEADLSRYEPSILCENCHRKIFVQHRFSTHHAAFSDPLFQAQFYGEVLPLAKTDARVAKEAKTCLACHSPITWLQGGKDVVPQEAVRADLSGVTCDFCHTVTGFTGERPGNANFIVKPGEQKFGPFKDSYDWHRTWAELQTRSELCALCHSAQNTHGLPVRTTYEEWQASDYAKQGIQCQDCHMNARGYLVDGVATFESGVAAVMTVGSAKERAKLFSHRFPGAHSASQMNGALQVEVRHTHEALVPGRKVKVEVVVDNSRAGHRMPSGSAELRVMWLEVRVGLSDETATELLPATPKDPAAPRDVAGAAPEDAELLGADVPAGARLYRAAFVDEAGKPTLDNYRAAKLVFDSRLAAGERRTEAFEYTVPQVLKDGDDLHVVATLKYLSAPSRFYARFGMPAVLPATVATGTGLVGAAAEDRGEPKRR